MPDPVPIANAVADLFADLVTAEGAQPISLSADNLDAYELLLEQRASRAASVAVQCRVHVGALQRRCQDLRDKCLHSQSHALQAPAGEIATAYSDLGVMKSALHEATNLFNAEKRHLLSLEADAREANEQLECFRGAQARKSEDAYRELQSVVADLKQRSKIGSTEPLDFAEFPGAVGSPRLRESHGVDREVRIVQRETAVAVREAAVAERESRVAKREAALVQVDRAQMSVKAEAMEADVQAQVIQIMPSGSGLLSTPLLSLVKVTQQAFWIGWDKKVRPPKQEVIIAWIQERAPGLSQVRARAVEAVACPMERNPAQK